MIWIAPSEKDTDNDALEKQLGDAADQFRANSGLKSEIGLPRTDNANYLWIQLFYSALNENGRAGFVMANSASDARSSEQELRRQLIESRADKLSTLCARPDELRVRWADAGQRADRAFCFKPPVAMLEANYRSCCQASSRSPHLKGTFYG